MTDTSLPPPASPTPPLAVPPGPQAPPVGRPRIWQAAVVFLAFGLIAGGSCAAFLWKPGAQSADPLAFVFLLTVPIAAAALTLLVFRIVRRRRAESWPTLGQCLLIGVAGAVLSVGGCGVWAVTMEEPAFLPVSFVFGAGFVVGLALAVGAAELFFVALARVIFGFSKR
jgi:hypothetical protein